MNKKNLSKKCDTCGKSFPTTGILRKHEEAMHHQKPHKMHVTQSVVSKSMPLQHNTDLRKIVFCNDSNIPFLGSDNLKNYSESIHGDSLFIKCEQCGECFASQDHLSLHVQSHHGTFILPGEKIQYNIAGISSTEEEILGMEKDIDDNFIQFDKLQQVGPTSEGPEIMANMINSESGVKNQVIEVHSSQRFECNVCGNKFKSDVLLKQHKQKKHSFMQHPFHCSRCDKVFASLTILRKHFQVHISGKRSIKCYLCSKVFWGHKSYVKHREQHSKDRKRKCGTCHKILHSVAVLNFHKAMHKRILIQCSNCPSVFINNYQLNIHRRNHIIERKYQCQVCKKDFKEFPTLRKHQKKHYHDMIKVNKNYKCLVCKRKFTEVSKLIKHQRAHIGLGPIEEDEEIYHGVTVKNPGNGLVKITFQCFVCVAVFPSEKELNDHIEIAHGNLCNTKLEGMDTEVESSYKMYQCSQCGDGIEYRKKEYSQHLEEYHSSMSCQVCDKEFESIVKCRKHFNSVHGEKKFNCEMCGKSFPNPSSLKMHVNTTHSENRPNVCDLCGCAFKTKYKLDNHVKHIHSEFNHPYTCEICAKTFKQKYSLEQHVKRHEQKETTARKPRQRKEVYHTTCERCGQTFATIEELFAHDKTHDALVYRCHLCGKSLVNSKAVKKHIKNTHNSVCTLKCNVCGAMFKSNFNLRRHQATHAEVRTFKCEFCNQTFNRASALDLHIRRHTGQKAFNCVQCGESFISEKEVIKHEEKAHIDENGEYSCPWCPMKLGDFKTFRLHKKLHTNPPQPESDQPKRTQCSLCGEMIHPHSLKRHQEVLHGQTDGNTIWACNLCPLQFTTKYALRQHAKKHDPVKKRYACNICNKVFKIKKSLNLHMVLHYYVFMCKVCGKTFNKRTSFSIHMRKHTHPKKKLSCEICGQLFSSRKIWYDHQKSHIGEKYECKHCGKFYSKISTLNIHIKTVHTCENKPFKCEQCGKGFDIKGSLTRHMQSSCKAEYECRVCGIGFSSSKTLMQHMQTHEEVKLECGECSLVVSDIVELMTHQQTIHGKAFGQEISVTDEYAGGVEIQHQVIEQGLDINYPAAVSLDDQQYIESNYEYKNLEIDMATQEMTYKQSENQVEIETQNAVQQIEVLQDDGTVESVVYLDNDYIISDEVNVRQPPIVPEDKVITSQQTGDIPVIIRDSTNNIIVKNDNKKTPIAASSTTTTTEGYIEDSIKTDAVCVEGNEDFVKQVFKDEVTGVEYEVYEYEVIEGDKEQAGSENLLAASE